MAQRVSSGGANFSVNIGAAVHFSKTVGESDVYQFAGITGDFAPNHVNEEYMKASRFGRRIAHGALLVGYMSAASSKFIESLDTADGTTPVSLGYDRVRFVAPVFLGDTITVAYEIAEYDADRRRSLANVNVTNQHGDTVAVATHIMVWIAPTD